MTKTEEIAHYRAFVEALPRNSYLADILAGTVPWVEANIRDDISWPLPLESTMQEARRGQEHVEALKKDEAEWQTKVARQRVIADKMEGRLKDLRTDAQRIAALCRSC